MKIYRYFILFIFVVSLNISSLFASEEIIMMTEVYPPYNMIDDGELTGISVDLLSAMLEYMNFEQSKEDILLTSWSRAYSLALNKKNYMVFSTTRTEQREHLFKWVGPIIKTKIGLIAKKNSHFKLASLADLNNYKIGTVLKDIGELLVLDTGVDKHNISSISGKDVISLSFKKLLNDRIDLFAYDLNVVKKQAQLDGYDVNDFEVIWVFKEADLFYAFNKLTSDDTIVEWQKALDSIKKTETYHKIIKRYIEQ